MTEKVVISWSGGKDSAMTLFTLKKNPEFEVVALLTTLTKDYDRVSMHGVRRELMERQAASIGLPLEKVFISKASSNNEYEEKMLGSLLKFKSRGVSSVAFGDIFLSDIRKYREEKLLGPVNLKGLFPIWGKGSADLAKEFVDAGFKSIICCIDKTKLDWTFAGRDFDGQFLKDLPDTVDICGENGEFHSFVYDGPIFRAPIKFTRGDIVKRDDRFYFCDLVPA